MKRIKIDKGEALITENVDSNNEGFIITVKRNEDYTFYLHIKSSTEGGNVVKDIVIPLKLLRPFKGFI